MATKPCRLTPLAETGLETVWRYTLTHWSRQADSYVHDLIDSLKAVCTSNGRGNDGNEHRINSQVRVA